MFRRRRALRGLDEDIRDHLERETQAHLERGLSPSEARRQARLAFGNVALAAEDARAVWAWRWAEDLRRDVVHAFRSIRRHPGFGCVVIVTLGLGIGANAAVFAMVDQVLLRTLPVARPDELVLLDGPGIFQGRTTGSSVFSAPMFRGLQSAPPVLRGLFARFGTRATLMVEGAGELISAELVSGEYFGTLGVGARLGRTLGPQDDRIRGGHPVIVLSHGYWQRRFAGDPAVVNRDIRVNGQPMTIVGVAAPRFSGVDMGAPADVFVPLMMKATLTPTWDDLDRWRTRWLTIMGRVAPGITAEQAQAALDVTYRQLLRQDVATARLSGEERALFLDKHLLVMPGGQGRQVFRDRFAIPLRVLMAMVGVLLVIACANVASLVLARAATQEREAAIQQALGAGRWRLARQRLTESAVLSAAGALAGVLLAWWTLGLLIEVLPFDRVALELSSSPDSRVVLFVAGVTVLTSLALGMGSAIHATRPALASAMSEESGRVVVGGQVRVRKTLVVVQVALSVLLLAGAALFGRSLANLRHSDPGFVAGDLFQFRVDAALSGYARERAASLVDRLSARLREEPGVTAVAMAVWPAMNNTRSRQTVRVQGYRPPVEQDMSLNVNTVGPGYFSTMGIPVVRGREFEVTDRDGAPKVAVVNETMARFFWGSQNPIGRRFGREGSLRDDEFEIVGVVRDSKFAGLRDERAWFYYVPYTQADTLDTMTIYVRHRPGVDGIPVSVRQAVQDIDRNLPMFDMKTVEAQVDDSLFAERMLASLSMFFGALATIVAAVGLYGIVSFTVARRTREIGVRVALGASRGAVLWMVLRDVVALASAGIVSGLVLALVLGRAGAIAALRAVVHRPDGTRRVGRAARSRRARRGLRARVESHTGQSAPRPSLRIARPSLRIRASTHLGRTSGLSARFI